MKKRILAILMFATVFLTVFICNVKASPIASKASVEDLSKNPQAFNNMRVEVQGSLVTQQIYDKPTQYYLRDGKNNMISLKFADGIDVSSYSEIKATGVFNALGKDVQMTVEEVTPIEAAPESQFVTGAQSTIVLMVYFSNRAFTKSTADAYEMIFNDVSGYYAQVSYDWVIVTGAWTLPTNMGQTVAHYGADSGANVDPNGWWIIRDAVAKADASVNFSYYSHVIVLAEGPNQESSGVTTDLWSSRWSGLSIPTNDGVTITHGMYVPDKETSPYGVLGVHCHEYGHELGLPDLYTYPSNILQYDLMDRGVWNNYGNTPSGFTSWCKIQQGWIMSGQIHTISQGSSGEYLRLDPLEDPAATTSVIKVPYGADYFLIEARRQVGFDAYIPAEGVIVLWVNSTTNRPYWRTRLSVGSTYEYGSFGIMVMGQDSIGWGYDVYVWLKTWQADTRLTNSAGYSEMNYGHKAVATVGPYVYVTWDDTRDGNWEIYLKRSTFYGIGWEADQRLTNNASSSWYPSIAAYGSYVYVVWMDNRDGNFEIYFKQSWYYAQAGYWYADQRLTNNASVSARPSVAVSGRNVYVTWYDTRDGNEEIYFKKSTDGGYSWSADTRLTNNASKSEIPSIAVVGANVYVVWQDYRNGHWDIYFKRSTNYGATWGSDYRLTTNNLAQVNPSIAAYGNDVYIAWADYRYGASNTEIFIRRSYNNGTSWYSEQRLTYYGYLSDQPVIAALGKSVYIVWQDNRTGTWEIYFKESPNKGIYWTPDRRLSATPYGSYSPSIAIGGADWNDVYVAWTDTRNGNEEIYFKYRW